MKRPIAVVQQMGERIRLRYSGLVIFAARLIATIAGIAFNILVVRKLTQTDLGTWQWIGRIASYTLIPGTIVNFWVGRFVARDSSYSKTGLVLNCLFMIPALSAYLVFIPVSASAIEATVFIFLVGAALVPLNYLAQAMSYIGGAIQPQYYGYSEMVFEAAKVLSAFLLVYVLHLALFGAVVTVEAALAMQFLTLIILSRRHFRSRFRTDAAKQWISYSWLSGYISESTILLTFDVIIIVALAGAESLVVLAYFSVAVAMSKLVGFAAGLAGGLTQRLLRGGVGADVEVILKLTLLFSIPMLVGTTVLARPLVYLYGGSYSPSVIMIRIFLVAAFLDLISNISDSVLMGTADIDKGKPRFKDLAKSRLFLLPSINIVMGAVYLTILYLLLAFFMPISSLTVEQIGILWAIALVSAKLPFISLKFWISRKETRFGIPYGTIAKYLVGAGIMGIALYLCLPFVVYNPSFFDYIIYPFALVGVGAAIYFAVILTIDKEFRQLARIVLGSIHLRRQSK